MKAFLRLCLLTSVLIWLSSCSSEWHLRRAIAKDPTILLPSKPVFVTAKTPEINFGDVLGPCIEWPDVQEIKDSATGAIIRIERVDSRDTTKEQDTASSFFRVTANVPESSQVIECPPCDPQIKYEPRPFWQKIVGWVLLAFVVLALAQRVFDRVANNR